MNELTKKVFEYFKIGDDISIPILQRKFATNYKNAEIILKELGENDHLSEKKGNAPQKLIIKTQTDNSEDLLSINIISSSVIYTSENWRKLAAENSLTDDEIEQIKNKLYKIQEILAS